jgi:hypothetical protein
MICFIQIWCLFQKRQHRYKNPSQSLWQRVNISKTVLNKLPDISFVFAATSGLRDYSQNPFGKYHDREKEEMQCISYPVLYCHEFKKNGSFLYHTLFSQLSNLVPAVAQLFAKDFFSMLSELGCSRSYRTGVLLSSAKSPTCLNRPRTGLSKLTT